MVNVGMPVCHTWILWDAETQRLLRIFKYIDILFLPVLVFQETTDNWWNYFGVADHGVYWGLLPDPMVRSMNSTQRGGLISTGTASIGERVLHDVLAWKPTSWTRNWGETTGHYLPLLLGST